MTNKFTDYAFATANTGTVGHERTLPVRLSDIANVKDYGATGDGVTDDLDAIMAAYNRNRVTLVTTASNQEASFTGSFSLAQFTGSISGTTLTVSGVTGTIAVGQTVGRGVVALAPGTSIVSGGGTTWVVSQGLQTVSSRPMATDSATFTGVITNNGVTNTLTVSGLTGTIAVGQFVYDGVFPNTNISSGSGSTWTVSVSHNVASQAMATDTVLTASSVTGTITAGRYIVGAGFNGPGIASQKSGTTGGAGVYGVNFPQGSTVADQNVPAEPMITITSTLTFASGTVPTTQVQPGMFAIDVTANVLGATAVRVESVTSSTVTLAAITGLVSSGHTITFNVVNRGVLYFPPGTYYVSGPIDIGPAGNHDGSGMTFGNLLGHQGASKIIGNFAGYVIARGMTENGNTFSGGSSVENLTIVNTHASGGGIRLGCGIGVTIRNCNVIANFAINLLNQDEPVGGEGGGAYYGSFEVCVIDCDLRPHDPATVGFTSSNVPASFGLARPSDGPTTNCSFIGFDVAAMTMGGEGAMPFRGCYFEGNNYAMGNAWGPGHPQGSAGTPVGGVQCLGCYFKNNGVAILATSAGGPYKGCAIEATEGTLAGGGNPQYGIYVPSGGHNIFQGFKITGQYQQAGVAILGNSGDACHMEGITVSNTSTLGGVKWILPPNATQAHFLACNVAPVYLFGNLSTTNYVVSTATWDSGTGLATVNVVPGLGDLPNRGTDGNSNAYITGVSVSGYNGLFSDVSTGLFSIVFPLANPGGSGSGGNMFFIVDSAVTQEGNCYDIRDGNTATWGAAVDSGGSNHVKVRFNPTGWTVVGK